jgi:WXG100 family type VII secretion target
MAPLFVVDYEGLARIASAFDREADRLRQTLQRVQRSVEVLHGGDWVGEGASAFYREMGSEVVPAMKSLVSALEAASRTTKDIAQNTKDAEDEIARLFAALLGAGLAAGIAGAVGSAMGQALGAGAGAVAGAAQAVGAAAAAAAAAAQAAQAAAAGRMLSGMDARVAEIAQQSPTLQANLAQLERDGWTITTRNGGGSETDQQHHTMVIDTSEAPEMQVGSLAHEGAHALYGTAPFHQPTAGMTRDQFIETNLRENMLDEANAQFNEAAIRDEVLGNGGPDTGVSGTQSADYQRIYNDFRDGNITREQAVGQMADIFPNETTGTTGQTYRDYYTPTYADWWDANVAPARGGAP